tara:strand:- start:285 stop:911 length:627 start_codon:yes stop_codon:yes gene_type:complete
MFKKILMSEKLLMIHIPKCAGITMNLIIGLDNPRYYGNKYGHHYADFVKNRMGDSYGKYNTFCIIRNPWDRLWSSYNFMKIGSTFMRATNKNISSFEDYVFGIYKTKKYKEYSSQMNGDNLYCHRQSNWIFDKNGNKIVDIVGKFEDLTSLVNHIDSKLELGDLSIKLKSTHSNKTKKPHYRSVYNKDMIDVVTEMYNDDIILGNYEY